MGTAIYYPEPDAQQRHLLVAAFHIKPTSKRCVVTVVVGKATGPASNEAPQVIALAAVPTTYIQSFCPFVGVPLKLVVKLVISAVCAVRPYISTLSVLIVGVALEVVVPTLGI